MVTRTLFADVEACAAPWLLNSVPVPRPHKRLLSCESSPNKEIFIVLDFGLLWDYFNYLWQSGAHVERESTILSQPAQKVCSLLLSLPLWLETPLQLS